MPTPHRHVRAELDRRTADEPGRPAVRAVPSRSIVRVICAAPCKARGTWVIWRGDRIVAQVCERHRDSWVRAIERQADTDDA